MTSYKTNFHVFTQDKNNLHGHDNINVLYENKQQYIESERDVFDDVRDMIRRRYGNQEVRMVVCIATQEQERFVDFDENDPKVVRYDKTIYIE